MTCMFMVFSLFPLSCWQKCLSPLKAQFLSVFPRSPFSANYLKVSPSLVASKVNLSSPITLVNLFLWMTCFWNPRLLTWQLCLEDPLSIGTKHVSSLQEKYSHTRVFNLSRLHRPPCRCLCQSPGELCHTCLALAYLSNKLSSSVLFLRFTVSNSNNFTIDPSTTIAHLNYW